MTPRRGLSLASALAVLALAGIAPRAAADEGEALYRDGHYEQALRWWRAAAEQGSAHAAYRLGACYADGVVVAQDFVEARRWLRRAAEQGDPRAQRDLGTLYDQGWGVAASQREALRWYRAAALQGDPAGEFNLASMIEQGQGVAPSDDEACRWYRRAVRHGIGPPGLEALRRLSARMSPAAFEACAVDEEERPPAAPSGS